MAATVPPLPVALLLLVAEAAPAAAPLPGPVPVVRVQGGGTLEGEVGVFDSSGRLTRRMTGLGHPEALAATDGGRFLVANHAGGTVFEIDETGALSWSWRGASIGLLPQQIAPVPGGGILVAGEAGVAEVRRDGAITWRTPLPIPGTVAGLGRSPDGSAILVLENQVWQLGPAGMARRLAFGGPAPAFLRGSPRPAGGIVLWDHAWPRAYEADVTGGRLVIRREVSVTLPTALSLGASGALVYVNNSFQVCSAPAATAAAFRVAFEPTAVIHLPAADRYLVSYRRTPDLTWPDTRPRPRGVPVFHRPRLFAWLFGALLVGAVLHALRWKRYPRRTPTAPALAPAPLETAPRPVLRGVALAAFAIGLALTALGQQSLTHGATAGWLPLSLGGALLAAAAAEAGRRVLLKGTDPFWAAVRAAKPDLAAWPLLLSSGVLVAIGVALLFHLSSRHADPADVTGLFLALNLLLLLTALLFASRRRFLPALLLPVGIAAVTLLYRLSDAPANDHFDFTWYAWSAWELLTGVVTNPWDAGFVPVPVLGLFPEMAGLALAGPGRVGFRLGSALLGITAPVAAYLLGAVYRDRRTGLLAGIFVAGSLPFIHFTRVPTAGDAATASLWMLALFALAVRSNNPGWWIATGSAAGFCLYLWPVARVGPLACLVTGLLLAVRSPRQAGRRWFGPALMVLALAVWVAPTLPLWIQNPRYAFPRAETSLEVYRFGEGIQTERLKASFGAPLRAAFGGFFVLPDNSSQGSLSPGLNDAEAVLLAVGLLIALIEGFSANVLLVTQFGLVFLVLGAFTGSPPWYTRLLPAAPIAAILMARAVVAGLDLFPAVSRLSRRALFALAAVVAIALSPALNLRRYLRYETAERPFWESTAIAHRLRELPKDVRLYILLAQRPDWSVQPAFRPPRLGEMLPLIWDLRLSEIHDPSTALPLPPGPKAIVVPAGGEGDGVQAFAALFPASRVESIRGRAGEPLAALVRIEE